MHASVDTILWHTKSSLSKFKHPLSNTDDVAAKWMGFWSNIDRPTMRYELFGVIPSRGQWKWKKERAVRAVKTTANSKMNLKIILLLKNIKS